MSISCASLQQHRSALTTCTGWTVPILLDRTMQKIEFFAQGRMGLHCSVSIRLQSLHASGVQTMDQIG
jgi:hypothetical protein